jgi:adenylosuccinate synthase
MPVRGGPAIEPPPIPTTMTTKEERIMKNLATATILTLALALPVAYAEQAPHGADQAAGSGMSQKMGGMGMGAMHERMQKMHQTMQEVHDTKDPEKRQRLIREHMQQMQQAMGGMQNMMGASSMGQNMDIEQRQQMMQKRIDMMQQMMGQMMEQMQAQQPPDKGSQ